MNPSQAWQATLGQLQMEMSKASYDTWVRDANFVSYLDDTFTIGVQNAYACDWMDSRLSGKVSRLLGGMMGRPQKVKFIVYHKETASDGEHEGDPARGHAGDALPASKTGSNGGSAHPPLPANPTLNARYSFDNFVVGASNRLAHAACQAVAENPGKAYNPLFLYGGVGLGKTHLLHAIGNCAHQHGLQALYVSSEEFTNDMINAIQKKNTAAFRERYRKIDVLLIDDIQFIANKEMTQEEFFHTFNTLHGAEKQIVLSSDRPPKALVTLEERLRSRFEWGLIADIQPPDLETRIAILRSKAERANKRVPHEILEQIARLVQSNIRELEGSLTRVMAFAELSGQPVSTQLVQVALADLLPQRSNLAPNDVLNAVAGVFGISYERLTGRDRSREVALPRQVAMYLLREEANISLPQIGEALGGRDHTTVMYACEKVADMIERDDRLRRQVIQVRERLYGNQRAL